MRRMTDADPFAVRAMTSAGEEIAFSDPYVSDAQRAAAGRETVAERMRALLPANRQRAAAAYAAGRLPDGQDLQRVWHPRAAAELRERLGKSRCVVWASGDVLHALWRGEAERVLLSGGLHAPMWPVEGAEGLWEASLRVRRLDEAVISVMMIGLGAADLMFGRPVTDTLTWRGPCAPGVREVEGPLAGEVRERVLESAALRGPRTVSVYLPPAGSFAGSLPGCVLADGEAVADFARVLEAAIASGAAPPVLLVGLHNAGDPADRSELRAQEYLPRYKPRRFAAHLAFATGEVIPWAVSSFPVGGGPWVSAGFSNGAAWAIGAAQRRPDVFGGVAGFSAGMVPKRVAGASRGVRHYLAAGMLEEGFRRSTREWASRLRRAGVPCSHHEWAGGHDPFWWRRTLPEALAWLLASGNWHQGAGVRTGRSGRSGRSGRPGRLDSG
jgi:enterochelin esterase-like enzyme